MNETWDESNPSRPKTMGYSGSEEFIRLQFEEYLLALLSSIKCRLYLQKHRDDPRAAVGGIEGDPALEFGTEWIDAWMKTENFRLFDKFTDSHLFDIVPPSHPCSGGLTIEDVQRRLAQQVAELHLDERFQVGREVVGKHLVTGQKKVSTAFNNLWADIEAMREAQRRKHEEARAAAAAAGTSPPTSPSDKAPMAGVRCMFSPCEPVLYSSLLPTNPVRKLANDVSQSPKHRIYPTPKLQSRRLRLVLAPTCRRGECGRRRSVRRGGARLRTRRRRLQLQKMTSALRLYR